VAVGDLVVKTHRDDLPVDVVAQRARLAATVPAVLSPVALPDADLPPYVVVVEGRAVTVWPRGTTLDRTDPDAAPWYESGALLARLHRNPPEVADGLHAAGPDRVARALRALAAAGAGRREEAGAVLAAAATLEPWTRGDAPWPRLDCLVHGDLHLGQLVVPPDADSLVLIDVDDLGLGTAAWDLARPAAWFLTGFLDEGDWSSFLSGYRDAGGPVLAEGRDPWPDLEPAARALTVQTAARALVTAQHGPLDTPAQWLVEACRRIVAVGSIPATP
jgi:aminoglycoside phosphotransferase (APT) family kinase protein